MKVEDKDARLACFEGTVSSDASSEPKETIGDWRYDKDVSKLDDKVTYRIGLLSYDENGCRYDDDPHMIFIQCVDSQTIMAVKFGDCFHSEYDDGGLLPFRIGKEKASQMRFRALNNEFFIIKGRRAIDFVKSLFGHDNLFLGYLKDREGLVSSEYKITGLEKAVKPVREACNW